MRLSLALALIGLLLGLPALGAWHWTAGTSPAKLPGTRRPPPAEGSETGTTSTPSPSHGTADPLVPPIELGGRRPASPPARSPVALPGAPGPALLTSPSAPFDFRSDRRARFHPHGEQVCASGCAANNHPTPTLGREKFLDLLAESALGPADETNQALETLLYYGRQTLAHLDRLEESPLPEDRLDFLRRELARTHVRIAFRLVDERGTVRTRMPPTPVPLDRRHVFEMETHNLQPLVTSGTVKRVGLHHLWTRI